MGWYEIASQLTEQLDKAQRGSRESVLEEFAQTVALARQTVRTYGLAYRFLNGLPREHADLRERLTRATAIGVEIIARWYRRDPEAALAAADLLASGAMTIKALNEAEGRSRPTATVSKLKGSRATIVKNLLTLDRFRGVTTVDRTRKVDVFARTTEGDWIPMMLVGPYSAAGLYAGKANDWWLKAVGLQFFYRSVGLLIPCNADPLVFHRRPVAFDGAAWPHLLFETSAGNFEWQRL